MPNRRHKRTTDADQPVTETAADESRLDRDRTGGRKRRWWRWGASLLVLVIGLVLIAPTILTRTKTHKFLLASIVPPEVGSISIESLYFGWLTPIRVDQLRVTDSRGDLLLEIAKIRGDRTLLQLAMNRSNLGKIVVTEPNLNAILRADGSNLEDAMVPWLGGAEVTANESSSMMVAVSLEIVGGEIDATEQESGTKWRIAALDALAELPSSRNAPWTLQAGGTLDGQPFAVEVNAPVALDEKVWPLGPQGKCKLTADALSLRPLGYLASRAKQSIDIEGALTLDIDVSWQTETNATTDVPSIAAMARVSTENLRLLAPGFLGEDVLQLPLAVLTTELGTANGLVTIRQCEVDSALGRAELKGSLNVAELRHEDLFMRIRQTLRTQPMETKGQIDIAELVRMLPSLLHVRKDIQLTSGKLAWEIANHVGQDEPTRWEGWARTQDIHVTQAGQPIDWQFPLQLEFAVSDGEQLSVESLTAKSDFFRVIGHGKLTQGNMELEADLQRLTTHIAQVVDLQGLDVRGGLRGEGEWNVDNDHRLRADGRIQLTQFELAREDQLIAREAELTLLTKATGEVAANSVNVLEAARVEVISGNDVLVAELQEPVSNPDVKSTWRVAVTLRGELANWQSRLQTVGVDLGCELNGQIDLTSQVTLAPATTTLTSLQGNIKQLIAATEGIRVKEPVVRFATAGVVDNETLAARFPESTFASGSLSLVASNIAVDHRPAFTVAGDVGFRADIARLMQHLPDATSTQTYAGSAMGRLSLIAEQNKTRFNFDSTVENLVIRQLGTPASVLWQEPKVTAKLEGEYDATRDQLAISTTELASNGLQLSGRGSASSLMTQPSVDVQGKISYDLQTLLQSASDYVGSDISIVAKRQDDFTLVGPLFPSAQVSDARVAEELTGQFGLAWDSARIYGVPLGRTRLDATLGGGKVGWSRIQSTVGTGLVELTPTLHLNTPELWITLEPGLLARDVLITPEMCKTWMRFVAPLMADATAAQGMFSVTMSKAEIPIMQPTSGSVAGQLVIHGGTLGPGPMAQQFLGIAQQVKQLVGKGSGAISDPSKAWIELSPQQIGFQLHDGRVYHEGFRMIVDGVPVQTRGSVGLDETLEIYAEIPVMDAWIAGQSALAGLRGQVIALPMTGTLSQPRINQQAIAQASSQLVRQAARGYLEKEVGNQLQKQLQKLFQ